MLLSHIKTYPYRERLPNAIIMLCLGAWIFRNVGRVTGVDAIGGGAIALSLFCGPRGRPFWFFWGIAVGVAFVAILPSLRSLFAH
jgi:hypothetical protein